ncbi:MAG TPA: DUF86 domain-containing protein [Leptospiraceae bacterium]|nr:DUF86 domain-containing protein [Leptospiraceae bacterium]HMW08002.1 DUF86 domain-containing protein [Leptospiraceae bacterium]HMX33628.1 DUF86 domain-containing protein [Leptospiraceae bacterium]HMY33777.1 DUF86 domain-containing protein [Leptospiraceae bacterium]HMZ64849.1 DUF86 domain-containing protein [Leptospiraceae bacterium]
MKDDLIYVRHILNEMSDIIEFSKGGENWFFQDKMTQKAIIRSLEVIGEAVKNISADFRESNPQVPWKDMAGMRDRLIHGYFDVSLERVWNVVENIIPSLKKQMENLL